MRSTRRWEISFLVGPCSEAEATALLEDLFDASEGRLGAVGSLGQFDERNDPPAGGFIDQPTKREMGVDAPDLGDVIG